MLARERQRARGSEPYARRASGRPAAALERLGRVLPELLARGLAQPAPYGQRQTPLGGTWSTTAGAR